MDSTALVFLMIGVVIAAVTVIAIIRARRRGLDEIFEGITPGMLPREGQQIGRRRIRDRAYTDHIAVQFTPPQGLRPGLVGTIFDGEAESRDVTATIVDLAVRGYVRIVAVEAHQPGGAHPDPSDPDGVRATTGRANRRGRRTPHQGVQASTDWEIIALDPPAEDRLSVVEAELLNGMFARGPRVRISELTSDFGQVMRESVQALYRETIHRGWYRTHPRRIPGPSGCALWGAAVATILVLAVVGITVPTALASAGLVLLSVIAWQVWGRVRPGRTAEGTAVRIQALGFEEYLRTAEADQIRFEEAADIFSRYLPYAIVFGATEHWAKVFGDIANQAKLQGFDQFDFQLDWIDMVLIADLLQVPEMTFLLADGLVDLVGTVDFDAVTEGLGAFSDGVTGFMDSVEGLGDLGDGCDGCDGFDF